MNSIALAKDLRTRILEMVHRARASHVGSALSIADILAVLYDRIMIFDPINPDYAQRDRFILSKGHACTTVYAALAEMGFFSVEQLQDYGTDHSSLMNHVSHKVPGVEFSTGALGHGLPFGVGKALAAKMRAEAWRVFVVMSDGELDEGSNWEAFMFAAHHKLDKITAIVDYNKLQSLGSVSNTLALEPLADKLVAFGWRVREVDGHSHEQLSGVLGEKNEGKPLVVIAHTTKGKGVSFMEDQVLWHYRNPNDDQLALALQELSSEDVGA